MNWWLISCLVSAAFAVIILFTLGAFKLADRSDRKATRIMRDLRAEADAAALWGDQHPYRER